MKVYQFSHLGKRPQQEDGLWISDDKKLFVVCDGVGGSQGGGLASEIILNHIKSSYNHHLDKNKEGLLSFDMLKSWILSAEAQLVERANEDENLTSIGATIVLLYLSVSEALVAHVGDSRLIYIDKKEGGWFATRDHSVVQELYDSRIIKTESEMRSHPQKNQITRVLSAKGKLKYTDITTSTIFDYRTSDVFLLLTDGAIENHTNQELVENFVDLEKDIYSEWLNFTSICKKESIDNNTGILIEL